MKTKTKIVITITAIWLSIVMIALFIAIKTNLDSFWSGLVLITINSILHATLAFNSTAIYNYFFKIFENKK